MRRATSLDRKGSKTQIKAVPSGQVDGFDGQAVTGRGGSEVLAISSK